VVARSTGPVAGTVRFVHYNPGRFLNAATEKSSLENEQMSVGLEHNGSRILVRQIAGLIARRIVTYSREGEQVEQGERIIVGVNGFKAGRDAPIELLKIDESVARRQIERVQAVRRERDGAAVTAALAKVEAAARGTENLMPPVLEAVKAYATLGEVCDVFRKVWGQYREGGAF
jgi:hypothetical protein